ncbi:MAG TPA: hypothetical protein VNJ10_11465 [Sphingomonas sp.]|nr:hypothetical protein [Sphingomonas sp.]
MFLDETHIWPRKDEPPRPPKIPFRHQKALSRILLFYAFILLFLPISLGSVVDMVRYVFD